MRRWYGCSRVARCALSSIGYSRSRRCAPRSSGSRGGSSSARGGWKSAGHPRAPVYPDNRKDTMATMIDIEERQQEQKLVDYRAEDGIAFIELDNPPANTYTYDLMQQLDQAIVQARFDDEVYVVVLSGHGERFFSAGANIGMMQRVTPRFLYQFSLYANETLNRLEHTPKLTIAALNGHNVGGGLEMALGGPRGGPHQARRAVGGRVAARIRPGARARAAAAAVPERGRPRGHRRLQRQAHGPVHRGIADEGVGRCAEHWCCRGAARRGAGRSGPATILSSSADSGSTSSPESAPAPSTPRPSPRPAIPTSSPPSSSICGRCGSACAAATTSTGAAGSAPSAPCWRGGRACTVPRRSTPSSRDTSIPGAWPHRRSACASGMSISCPAATAPPATTTPRWWPRCWRAAPCR